jgi:hypothetical protein
MEGNIDATFNAVSQDLSSGNEKTQETPGTRQVGIRQRIEPDTYILRRSINKRRRYFVAKHLEESNNILF